ncbi:MAG: PD40 domain-containing protein [Bacteroidetes bacterium]|nr:PD40 domain-containing protein [Bacteroidota bacterium]
MKLEHQKRRSLTENFEAEKEGNAFKNIKELEFNGEEYSCAYPTISQNGKRIYYTSDRSGGKGGKDLYMSEFKKGKWSKPINLDIAINSSGNERFLSSTPMGLCFFQAMAGAVWVDLIFIKHRLYLETQQGLNLRNQLI